MQICHRQIQFSTGKPSKRVCNHTIGVTPGVWSWSSIHDKQPHVFVILFPDNAPGKNHAHVCQRVWWMVCLNRRRNCQQRFWEFGLVDIQRIDLILKLQEWQLHVAKISAIFDRCFAQLGTRSSCQGGMRLNIGKNWRPCLRRRM